MANQTASCEDKMPADLFKRALESLQKRAMTIVNLILAGHYECKPADLEARGILLCKDASSLLYKSRFESLFIHPCSMS